MARRCPWKKRGPAALPPPRPSSFVRGEHEFRIVGCSAADDAHYSVLSGAFQFGGHTWALDCSFAIDGHLLSVFLELLTPYVTEDYVVAKAGLRIEDPRGECPAAEWRSDDAHTFAISYGGDAQAGRRSWKLPVPDEFRAHGSRYLQDDRLTIICTLEVLHQGEDGGSNTVADDIQKLLFLPLEPESTESPESDKRRRHECMLPDVTFVVEEAEIQAHRIVLAMRSPVFAAELLGDMREGTARRVRVDDMRASVFRAMVRFIYTDKLPIKAKTTEDADEGASGSSRRACKERCAARRRVAMACDLLAAADRYDLEKLRLMCEEILYESMGVASVMPTLMAVHGRHSCGRLEASCIGYLASDAAVYAAVKATDEYKELRESCNSFLVEIRNKVATHKTALKYSSSSSLDDTVTNIQRPKTRSVSTYDTSKLVYATREMRIPKFRSLERSWGVGIGVKSKTFQVDGYEWRLVVYPQKAVAKQEHIYVSIELLTDPGIAGVRASVCLGMNDPSGKSAPTAYTFQPIFTRKTPVWWHTRFTTMKYAEKHYLAHDGSLTIQCSVMVTASKTCISTGTTTTSAGVALVRPPPHDIARHLEKLLAGGKGSDVTFLVEKREIRAHKLVIAARCPVLYDEVAGMASKAEDGVIIPIDDMKGAVLEAVLHFVYTGELPPTEDMALASRDGVLIVGDMLAAAGRFRLDMMKARCETLLAESISNENASSTLGLARHHGLSKLEDYCEEFISSEYAARYRPRCELDVLKKFLWSYLIN